MQTTTIGFIGIGHMGWPMAARLSGAGHRLIVTDSDATRARAFAAEHASRACRTSTAMAQDCDVVITMLPTSATVEKVLFGEASVAAGLRPEALVIDMTSGVPSHTRLIADRLASMGIALVDAPVSGGVKRAQTGELSIMAGGEDADLERATPLLQAMGNVILRTGGVGTAHAMKALNNLVSASGFVAGVEALLIGKRFGLDPSVMVDVLNASTGTSNSSQKKFKQFVLSGAFNSGFALDLMLKDLGIALDLARDHHVAVPLSSACHQLWEAASNHLGAGHDHTEVARLCSSLAGVDLAN